MEGETCERCGTTEEEVEKAFNKLEKSLQPLGIEVNLEKGELSEEEFKENPENSNLVLIQGKPLEDWLNADTGKNDCCDVCGDEKCRTVIVNGEEYEAVPSDLIIEAGLKAASEEIGSNCCDSEDSSSGCCSC